MIAAKQVIENAKKYTANSNKIDDKSLAMTSDTNFYVGGPGGLEYMSHLDYNSLKMWTAISETNDTTDVSTVNFTEESGYMGGMVTVDLNNGLSPFSPDRWLKIVVNLQGSGSFWAADIYSTSGWKVGKYTMQDTVLTSLEVIPIPSWSPAATDYQTIKIRDWWDCSTQCSSVAHVACYGNKDCMMLLIFSNLGIGIKRTGLGSLSIVAACGIVCAKNPNAF